MKYITITILALNLLLISGLIARSAADSTTVEQRNADQTLHSDSIMKKEVAPTQTSPSLNTTSTPKAKDSISSTDRAKNKRVSFLSQLQLKRSAVFDRSITDSSSYSPFLISNQAIYRSDKTSPSELLNEFPLFVSTPFGLSSSLNRTLYFGNTAPLTALSANHLIDVTPSNPFTGTDQQFLTETATLKPGSGSLAYETPSYSLTVPEVLLMWENGVFNENTLNVKLSRPFTRSLSAHIFSNYRHFSGQAFNHQGNDVHSTFVKFQDSASVSDEGYNPLTNEFATGAGIRWSDTNSTLDLSVHYGEFNNEIAIDKKADIDKAAHAMYYRYPLSVGASFSTALSGPWFTQLETFFHDEPVVRYTGENVSANNTNTLQSVRKDGKDTRFAGGLNFGLNLFSSDSAGLKYTVDYLKRVAFTDSEAVNVRQNPSVYYIKNFSNTHTTISAEAGPVFVKCRDSSYTTFRGKASGVVDLQKHQLRLFVHKDVAPLVSGYDSLTSKTFYRDDYLRAGCELYLDFSRFNLLLGYQLVKGIDSITVANAWPSGMVPYTQPQSVFAIAPSLIFNKSFSIKTNALLSDSKPYVKAHVSLNYSIHPENTQEYIDFNLYTDYWSERDPVTFAGRSDWNRAIINSGLEIAAHIRSFRLFYKVDNILDRHFAYVPGYYSPGITFRWGFNWFIQG